ncbi:tautomerase family protein [Enterococcus gilvus]|uniref:4-oxalocrotonate tautomerase family enzyme n=1 Tax=Enterococcus gilvus ATCC BAA-350 TaxID=1158614 RepID=R2VCN4_9ENTE|nr:tautomerase family protein [Enterococcus gilvus]EOI55445.1 4-oxalocrotonate tautomerase family enzyme [Enterococcus gilvus ATCC BAA-350]EOW82012.1 hypothetical protein I592_01313 [Enterococcus gilvus ATCC BAA-350]OJG43041.1 4-oxalocrotonate tautomerase family enzyme [Enterococcus gilvus]
MSIVQIYGWKGISSENKKAWIRECTSVISESFQEPLDEITVFINEIPSENWGQAGAVGTDDDWLEKSRVKTLEDNDYARN